LTGILVVDAECGHRRPGCKLYCKSGKELFLLIQFCCSVLVFVRTGMPGEFEANSRERGLASTHPCYDTNFRTIVIKRCIVIVTVMVL
jgi:hypothetical protein